MSANTTDTMDTMNALIPPRAARAGQVVVFSPACSSFDMFEDYAARGRAFKKLLGALAAEARQ